MIFQPLAGIRVLDLSRLLPGPYCTMLLADMGAEVIKVETPRIGDYARLSPDNMGGNGMFKILNRNKKSIALNYRNPRGRALFLQLAQNADIIVESFRPGAVSRWGIDYEAVQSVNPAIIYCSLSGYGQNGPLHSRAGHDLNYIALGGLLALNGSLGGPPIMPGVQIADLAGAMLAAVAILGALVGRGSRQEGTYLDVAMLDAVISWVAPVAGGLFFTNGRRNPARGQMPLSGSLPCYNVYQTADDRFLSVGALEPDFWATFCRTVVREDLIPRQFDTSAISEVRILMQSRSCESWLGLFREVDACVEPVNTFDEMLRHPQVQARGLADSPEIDVRNLRQTGSPFPLTKRAQTTPAPALGEHTWEILESAGWDRGEIQALEAAGVVKSVQHG
ncbi:MAG: CoA transferase [Chloroflexi bacterium]|nr:CoA transferase [Chloroflexota bacterium]